MTTYIDLESLAPTDELAEQRAQLLGLSGTLVPRELRYGLFGIEEGTIICGPQALNTWRILPPTVTLVSIEDLAAQDPLPLRFDDLAEWHLVYMGLPRSVAKNLRKHPPVTVRHQYWECYRQAMHSPMPTPEPLPDDLTTIENEEALEVKQQPFTVTLVNDGPTLAQFISKVAPDPGIIGIDVETDVVGSEPNEMADTLVGIGIAIGNDCFFGYANYQPWMVALRDCLANVPWVGHNGKYDLSVLRRHGINPGPLVGDGSLAAYLRGEPNARLKDLVLRRFGVRMVGYEDVVGRGAKRIPISQADPGVVAAYCCADAFYGVEIERLLESELSERLRKLYHGVDVPLVTILADMQAMGIAFDRPAAAKELGEMLTAQLSLTQAIDILAERSLNPASSKQLSDYYYRDLGLPVQRVSKQTGKPSVDALSLLRLKDKHPTIPPVLAWKQLQKYTEFLVQWIAASYDGGRLHSTINNARVRTHRFSSEHPNLQQVKLDWRSMFLADEGTLLVAGDYDGIEWRLGAYVARDPGLLKMAQALPGTEAGDLHGQNVKALFNIPYNEQRLEHNRPLRTRAKNYFFGAMYGSKGEEVHDVIEKQMLTDPALAALGIPTVKEIRAGIMGIHDIYGRYFKEWIPFAIHQAIEQGCTAYTLYGRPRILPDLVSKDKQLREAAERECISLIIQGSAADVMRLALIDVAKIPDGFPLLTVHDEIVCGVNPGHMDWYMVEMNHAMQLGQPFEGVPLVINIKSGKNWKETHQ